MTAVTIAAKSTAAWPPSEDAPKVLSTSEIDAAGWLSGVRRIPSPNCDERPAQMPIKLLVIHAISLPPNEFGSDDVIRLFTNQLDEAAHPAYGDIAGLRVSAHFFIRRDGALIQFVPCKARAWHSGVSCYQGETCCNDFSIGVELEGCDTLPFTDSQYSALAALIQRLARAYPLAAVTGHQHIAPARKTDPGPCFDWQRLSALIEAPCYWPDNPSAPEASV